MIKVKSLQDINDADYLFVSPLVRDMVNTLYLKKGIELVIENDILFHEGKEVAILVQLK